MTNTQILIYQTEDGQTKIDVRMENDTVWLSQEQIAELFQRERSVITKHINNIFIEGELAKKAMCKFCTLLIRTGRLFFTTLTSFGNTAVEVIYSRADGDANFMGPISWMGYLPTKGDAVIAKNYLYEVEIGG